jgi:hypothetical protein
MKIAECGLIIHYSPKFIVKQFSVFQCGIFFVGIPFLGSQVGSPSGRVFETGKGRNVKSKVSFPIFYSYKTS